MRELTRFTAEFAAYYEKEKPFGQAWEAGKSHQERGIILQPSVTYPLIFRAFRQCLIDDRWLEGEYSQDEVFHYMAHVRLVVRSWKSDFNIWLRKLERYYTAKTGMKLFPGTLNVHQLDQTFPTPDDRLRLDAAEYGGRVSVSIVPCRICGREAFILRPDTDRGKHGDPPESILDVATDVKLREAYQLADGDVVEVEANVG